MNWLMSRVTLRVRSVSEVLDLAFVFCAENRKAYGKLALAFLVGPFVVCLTLQLLHVDWWIVWSVAVVLGAIVEGAFAAAAGQLLFAVPTGIRPLVGPFGRRFFPYLAARLTATLALLACAVVIVPFPLIAARALYVPEFSILEAASPVQCLRRGGQLTKVHTAQTALLSGLLLLARLAFVAGTDVLGQGLFEFVLQLGRPLGSLFEDGGSTYALAGFFISIPYVAAARFLGYVDSRTRREGWDIQVRFSGLAQRASSEEAAA